MVDQVCPQSQSYIISNVVEEFWKGNDFYFSSSILIIFLLEPRPVVTKMRRKVCFSLSMVLNSGSKPVVHAVA